MSPLNYLREMLTIATELSESLKRIEALVQECKDSAQEIQALQMIKDNERKED
jgi:hypothetical protein